MVFSVEYPVPIASVYTDVGIHLEWIEETTRVWSATGAEMDITSRSSRTKTALGALLSAIACWIIAWTPAARGQSGTCL